MLLIGDSESNGLKSQASHLWMIVTFDIHTLEYILSLREPLLQYDLDGIILLTGVSNYKLITIEEHLDLLSTADRVVFHNGLMHDFPLFKRLYHTWQYPKSVDDTFIMSSLFNPDREAPPGSKKPHSIEAWGIRFGMKKVGYDQWDTFTALMLLRCIEDVKIGIKTYEALRIESKGWDWSRSLQLEYMMAKIQAQQEMNGVLFDTEKAYQILESIDKEVEEIDTVVIAQIPKRVVPVGAEVAKPFKKNGEYTKQVEDWIDAEDTKMCLL